MSNTEIIILISLILVISVVGSIIFTKREQAAAIKRQKVANYRFKADEAQDLYDGLVTAGLEKITYEFLLQRIVANLQATYDLAPRTPGVFSRLKAANETLHSLETTNFQVMMPSSMEDLQGLVGRLNKLVKYLIILFQKRVVAEADYQKIMPSVQRTLLKFDVEGHIKLGYTAENDGLPGTAREYYVKAKEKLDSYDTDDLYFSEQLEKVESLLKALDEKQHESVIEHQVIEEDGAEQVSDQETATEQSEDQAQPAAKKSDEKVNLSQAEMNKLNDDDDGFENKKKW
ncbi:MAG: hypothetical protein DRQ47_06100 [Gammaproteobacteria bacterium]|nr:MAG: hypothetical protein DRQ47_06100 [Gammaproteobacteria bacterium]